MDVGVIPLLMDVTVYLSSNTVQQNPVGELLRIRSRKNYENINKYKLQNNRVK